ncbi:18370_t:CDS:1, partial [Gigaspora rosea]
LSPVIAKLSMEFWARIIQLAKKASDKHFLLFIDLEISPIIFMRDKINSGEMCISVEGTIRKTALILASQKLVLRDRVFVCTWCRHKENRDINSAKNILYQAQITELGTNFDSQGKFW